MSGFYRNGIVFLCCQFRFFVYIIGKKTQVFYPLFRDEMCDGSDTSVK